MYLFHQDFSRFENSADINNRYDIFENYVTQKILY